MIVSLTVFSDSTLSLTTGLQRTWQLACRMCCNLSLTDLWSMAMTVALLRFPAAVMAALLLATPLQAHHSDRMIAGTEPVWIKGTVTEYRPINPHAIIRVDVTGDDGQVVSWTIEGPRLARVTELRLDHDIVAVGDVIGFCGFYPVREVLDARPKPDYIHAKILVTPDGQKYQWGPYGRLNTCVPEAEWGSIYSGGNPLRP
jgi:hypothetical protein